MVDTLDTMVDTMDTTEARDPLMLNPKPRLIISIRLVMELLDTQDTTTDMADTMVDTAASARGLLKLKLSPKTITDTTIVDTTIADTTIVDTMVDIKDTIGIETDTSG